LIPLRNTGFPLLCRGFCCAYLDGLDALRQCGTVRGMHSGASGFGKRFGKTISTVARASSVPVALAASDFRYSLDPFRKRVV
jgi:hypothetical protein